MILEMIQNYLYQGSPCDLDPELTVYAFYLPIYTNHPHGKVGSQCYRLEILELSIIMIMNT